MVKQNRKLTLVAELITNELVNDGVDDSARFTTGVSEDESAQRVSPIADVVVVSRVIRLALVDGKFHSLDFVLGIDVGNARITDAVLVLSHQRGKFEYGVSRDDVVLPSAAQQDRAVEVVFEPVLDLDTVEIDGCVLPFVEFLVTALVSSGLYELPPTGDVGWMTPPPRLGENGIDLREGQAGKDGIVKVDEEGLGVSEGKRAVTPTGNGNLDGVVTEFLSVRDVFLQQHLTCNDGAVARLVHQTGTRDTGTVDR